MSRRNVLANISGVTLDPLPLPETGAQPSGQERAPSPPLSKKGPVAAWANGIEALVEESEKAKADLAKAKEITERFANAESIVEIDPGLIDPSFARDRIAAFDPEGADAEFVSAIREQGQLVPALLRPNLKAAGRFQPAYGRRRIAAAAFLGRRVRAIVRDLTDEELVVAQGQENEARNGLTFIEKCRFAATLEAQGFKRKVIESALSVQKTHLSVMLQIVESIPGVVLDWVGPAPEAGRPRWLAFAGLLSDQKMKRLVVAFASRSELPGGNFSLPGRFAAVLDATNSKSIPRKPLPWTRPGTKKSFGALSVTQTKITLTIDRKAYPALADLAIEDLEALRLKLVAAPLPDPSTSKKG